MLGNNDSWELTSIRDVWILRIKKELTGEEIDDILRTCQKKMDICDNLIIDFIENCDIPENCLRLIVKAANLTRTRRGIIVVIPNSIVNMKLKSTHMSNYTPISTNIPEAIEKVDELSLKAKCRIPPL